MTGVAATRDKAVPEDPVLKRGPLSAATKLERDWIDYAIQSDCAPLQSCPV